MSIENYMDDGANWQAQAVLAVIRRRREEILSETWNKEYHMYNGMLHVGRYENCREQGYVFCVIHNGTARNYAVYEHRNSDDLCVLIANGVSINTPGPDFMWKEHVDENGETSKYDYDKGFECGQIMECAQFIVNDMIKFIDEQNERFMQIKAEREAKYKIQ